SHRTWQFDLDLATALRITGRIAEADALLGATAAEAAARGDRRVELHARLAELEFSESAVSHHDLAEQALREFEQAGDERVANMTVFLLVHLLVWGPTPVVEALRRIEGEETYQEHPLIMSPRAH